MDLQIVVHAEQVPGSYANVLATWHTAHEFTLDFCVMLSPVQGHGDSSTNVLCPVVSRLKIPVTILFSMLQAMHGIMARDEDRFGPIKRVGEDESA